MVLGPFIEDDETLCPLDKNYPDHGIGSLPSVKYMNHDKLPIETEFLSLQKIEEMTLYIIQLEKRVEQLKR